ncbi:hypothetical protein AOLI_G00119400 [Acnodon oligacanthus]
MAWGKGVPSTMPAPSRMGPNSRERGISLGTHVKREHDEAITAVRLGSRAQPRATAANLISINDPVDDGESVHQEVLTLFYTSPSPRPEVIKAS